MSVDEFLERILRSRLMTIDQLRRLMNRAPDGIDDTPEMLADWMVAAQALTSFQASSLLAEKFRRLMVDHYEIRDFIGKGGMGTVYLARDRRNDRLCALKILPPEKRSKNQNVLRFLREMAVSQRLSHQGIAVAYDAGTWKGVHYLAMEFVPGPTLYQLVKRNGPTAPAWATKWLSEVAAALDYAHQQGVVHRDLKPSNVIVTPQQQAKLLDLGLARWYLDDHNEEKVVGRRRIVGSFDYMAPEQSMDSASADARSDIYGLGCLLYFALCGRPPFEHVADKRLKITHHRLVEPEPIVKLCPEVPRELADVLHQKMLAKNPEQRFQLAIEAQQVLASLSAQLMRSQPSEPPSSADSGPEPSLNLWRLRPDRPFQQLVSVRDAEELS